MPGLGQSNGKFNSLTVDGDTTLKGPVTFDMDSEGTPIVDTPIVVFEGDEDDENPSNGIGSLFVVRPFNATNDNTQLMLGRDTHPFRTIRHYGMRHDTSVLNVIKTRVQSNAVYVYTDLIVKGNTTLGTSNTEPLDTTVINGHCRIGSGGEQWSLGNLGLSAEGYAELRHADFANSGPNHCSLACCNGNGSVNQAKTLLNSYKTVHIRVNNSDKIICDASGTTISGPAVTIGGIVDMPGLPDVSNFNLLSAGTLYNDGGYVKVKPAT
jgi:hypothetical protein